MKINEILSETIRKVEGGYRLVSHKGKNLGTFPSKSGAQKHEREVQYFKHMSEAGGGHYDMPTKQTFMIVVSDGKKKRDLVSAESPKEADSIARSLRSKYPGKTITIEKRTVAAQQYNEGDVISMNTRRAVTPRTDSMLGAFGGVLKTLKQIGISMAEKPDYIDSDLLSNSTSIDELSLRRIQKAVGNLPVYKVNDIYPKKKDYTEYLQSKIENLPSEELFIVDFSEVNHDILPSRYLVRRSANSLRWWAPII
jgi:hypothetical protein